MSENILPKIEASRKELLDLGMRNTLLNYKKPNARGLTIVQEQSLSVYDISFIFKAGFILICCFSFTIALLKAQTQRTVEFDLLTENLTSTVLYPLFLTDFSTTSYKNIPSGTEKSVLTFFHIDRIQSTYERYMVNDNDSAAWNKYANERNIQDNQVYDG